MDYLFNQSPNGETSLQDFGLLHLPSHDATITRVATSAIQKLKITQKETCANDVTGLETKLKCFSKEGLPWLERLDVSITPETTDETEDESAVHDDFKRELNFYRQAEKSVLQAIPRLRKLSVPTKRLEDYFAQMVKSDDQMKLVRGKLLTTCLAAEISEKATKLREQKTFGKKVQVEVLKSRQKDKRDMLEQVKKYRKGQQDKLDFLEGDKLASVANKRTKGGKKREWKNKKFGFGGQKKRSKGNSKASYNDSRDFSVSKNSKATNRSKI